MSWYISLDQRSIHRAIGVVLDIFIVFESACAKQNCSIGINQSPSLLASKVSRVGPLSLNLSGGQCHAKQSCANYFICIHHLPLLVSKCGLGEILIEAKIS